MTNKVFRCSEALLALPALAIFKREDPSSENQRENVTWVNWTLITTKSRRKDASTRRVGKSVWTVAVVGSKAKDRCGYEDIRCNWLICWFWCNSLNHSSQRNNNAVLSTVANDNVDVAQSDNNNNVRNNMHQLIYASKEEYPPTSLSGNHVSSSQGNELNEDCRLESKSEL